ncbi:MAG: 50S ribosomal protein L4 [Candidatus Altiarchaeota archaeon]
MVKVYSLDGKTKGSVELPRVFSAAYRPDIIQRTVVAALANLRQPYATSPLAGLQTSGNYFGSRKNHYRQTINKGMSRLPRVKTGGGGLGRVVRLPQAKGGRRAHPPKGKDYSRKINKKELKLALDSAVAATGNRALVESHGHIIGGLELPVVFEDKLEGLKKASDVKKALVAVGLHDELDSGKRKKILIIVKEDKGIRKAASNISGVDVATVDDMGVDVLAPGAKAGRLTVWSESAIKNIK